MQVQKTRNGYKRVKSLFGKYEEIPEGWEKTTIGAHTSILVGYPFPSNEYSENLNGIKLLRGDNITEGKIRWGEKTRFWKYSTQFGKYQLKENDFVIGMDGSKVGKNYAYITKQDLPCLLVQRVACLRSKNNLHQNYLGYVFGEKFLNYVNSTKTNAAIPHISTKDIQNFELFLPSFQEQQKIVSILSSADSLINQTQKEIEQTQKLKKGLMQKLLTKGIGHTNFKEINFHFGKMMEIPEEWKVGKLKDNVTKIGSGITPRGGSSVYKNNGIPLIRSQNVHFDGLYLENVVYISKEIHEEMKNTKLKPLDVLLNITGASIGRCTFVPENFGEGNVNQHVCIIRPNENLYYGFLKNFLSTHMMQHIINSSQAGLSRQGLNFQEIGNFLIPLPSLVEQRKISGIINNVTNQINYLIKCKVKLGTLKKGLMQKLLTGQIRVRV